MSVCNTPHLVAFLRRDGFQHIKRYFLAMWLTTEWGRPLMADRQIFSFLWKINWLDAMHWAELWDELNTGHSEVEALERLENPSPTKQPSPSSRLSFIPVNMLRYPWKGLIQRLFCRIIAVYSTSCQSQETKEGQEKHEGNEGGGDCSLKKKKIQRIHTFLDTQMFLKNVWV